MPLVYVLTFGNHWLLVGKVQVYTTTIKEDLKDTAVSLLQER